jgi:transcriptional regulator with XRE-family HTH domain
MKNEFDYTRLQMLREVKGMTQTQVAKKMGTKKQAVSQWEIGNICPSSKNLAAYCTAIGVHVSGCFRVTEGDKND